MSTSTPGGDLVILAGSGARVAVSPALGYRLIMRGGDGDAGFSFGIHDLAPRALGAPTHTHEVEDEYSYVLSGRLGAQIGGDVVEAGPGDTVVKPRGIPHAFWNAGDDPVVFIEVISPAGFERYFAEMAPLLAAGGPRDLEAIAEVQARYRLSMDFGSMGELIERHDLEPPLGASQ
jgi:mannose-6-phosphate isomerase-like protein (cupin superfamily)